MKLRILLAALALLLASCTNVNVQLNDNRLKTADRLPNRTRSATLGTPPPLASADDTSLRPSTTQPLASIPNDPCFVGIAISGGGSRSANFSAACMFQLERLGLLQKTTYISSVSGGSLTAAYYCSAIDAAWNPAVVQNKLTHEFASDLIGKTFAPWNMLGMMFSDLDRSDLLAETFEKHLYSRNGRGLTFGDLRADRPRLLINATDLQSGRQFIFSNESFDQLNSNLSKFPLSYAVAASSAVPVLMHQVTLRDYSTDFKQYVHLIDGGIFDNLGVQSLIETYSAQINAAHDRSAPKPYPKGALLILIDAKTNFDAQLSAKGDTGFLEGLKMAGGLSSTALLSRVGTATISDLIVHYTPDDVSAKTIRSNIKQFDKDGYVELRDRFGRPVKIVHLALSRVNDLSNLPFTSFRERVNSIATYFNIDPTEAYNLYQAAELLVKDKFEPLLRQLNSEIESPTTAPTTAPIGVH